MIKSCFCVFLSVALFVFLSLSSFADLPSNDVEGGFSFRSLTLSGYSNEPNGDSTVTSSYNSLLSFGELYVISISINDDDYNFVESGSYDIVFDLNIDSSFDIYFFHFISDNESFAIINSIYDYPSSSYIDPSFIESNLFVSDITSFTGSIFNLDFTLSSDFSSLTSSGSESLPFTGDVGFYGISNLNPSHYRLTFSGGIDISSSFIFPLGIFIDVHDPSSSDPILDYIAGNISFSDAASSIRDDMNSIISDPESSDINKQMAIAIADNKLDQLRQVSDEKFAVLVDQFDSSSSAIVNYYISTGSTDVIPAIENLNSSYTDILTQTTSPDQGVLINTEYSLKLAQLQTVFDVNYKKELDGVLTDQDMTDKEQQLEKVDSLLSIEDEALTIFDESEYQSQLVFQSWISQFSGDVTAYRSVFDFLFEDPRTSRFQPFLTIPFSLVLVGVLLSTTTVVFRRRG